MDKILQMPSCKSARLQKPPSLARLYYRPLSHRSPLCLQDTVCPGPSEAVILSLMVRWMPRQRLGLPGTFLSSHLPAICSLVLSSLWPYHTCDTDFSEATDHLTDCPTCYDTQTDSPEIPSRCAEKENCVQTSGSLNGWKEQPVKATRCRGIMRLGHRNAFASARHLWVDTVRFLEFTNCLGKGLLTDKNLCSGFSVQSLRLPLEGHSVPYTLAPYLFTALQSSRLNSRVSPTWDIPCPHWWYQSP